jgi:hypothetical protein
LRCPMQTIQDRLNLLPGENNREPWWSLCVGHIVQPGQRLPKDFPVQEEPSAQSLILCRGAHPGIQCER